MLLNTLIILFLIMILIDLNQQVLQE